MPLQEIAIVGGGLVGSLCALPLARHVECHITVYEMRKDLRREPLLRGKSINLALSTRGLVVLERAGIAGAVRDIMIPMRGRMLHSLDGSLTEVLYGVFGEAINSISRR